MATDPVLVEAILVLLARREFSTHQIAEALTAEGFSVSQPTVARIAKKHGLSAPIGAPKGRPQVHKPHRKFSRYREPAQKLKALGMSDSAIAAQLSEGRKKPLTRAAISFLLRDEKAD